MHALLREDIPVTCVLTVFRMCLDFMCMHDQSKAEWPPLLKGLGENTGVVYPQKLVAEVYTCMCESIFNFWFTKPDQYV